MEKEKNEEEENAGPCPYGAKKAQVAPPIARRRECNKIYNRESKCKERLDPGEREVWEPAQKKNSFVNKFPGLYANIDIRKSGVDAEEFHTEQRSYEVSHGLIDSGQAESEGRPKSKSQRIGNE